MNVSPRDVTRTFTVPDLWTRHDRHPQAVDNGGVVSIQQATLRGMTELEPYELADPGRLLTDVVAHHQLTDGDALLVLVRHPSTEQAVLRARRARLPAADSERDPSDYLAREAARLRVPAGRPPTHAIVTITARRGFTVFGRLEVPWFNAWRYANAHVDAYIADHVLVTEHGWLDFMSGLAGHEPALET